MSISSCFLCFLLSSERAATKPSSWRADYINLGDAIYSPGDMFIYLGEWLFGYTAIMWLGLALRRLMLPTF